MLDKPVFLVQTSVTDTSGRRKKDIRVEVKGIRNDCWIGKEQWEG